MTPTPQASDVQEAILLVDADVVVRHAIAEYLRHCGYAVTEAATSDEAVTVLSDGQIRIDAVLCDVAIAGALSGFELCIWVKENRRGLNFILSGSVPAAAGAAAELCEQGPQLARPYDPDSVVEHIKNLLAKGETGRP